MEVIPKSKGVEALANMVNNYVVLPSESFLVIFTSIRGNERLSIEFSDFLTQHLGMSFVCIICGDYSRPPNFSHRVIKGLIGYSENLRKESIYFQDTPFIDITKSAKNIANWLQLIASPSVISEYRPKYNSAKVEIAINERVNSASVNLEDGEEYERSLLGYINLKKQNIFFEKLYVSSHITRLNLGMLSFDCKNISLPQNIQIFRSEGLFSTDSLFKYTPQISEIVMVGGGMKEFKIEQCSLYKLEHLILDKNVLSELPANLQDAHELTILSFFRNQISSVPFWIRKLKKLESLSIGGNPIQDIPEWLLDLPNLIYLNLWNMSLNKQSFVIINKLLDAGVNVRLEKVEIEGVSILTILEKTKIAHNDFFPTLEKF